MEETWLRQREEQINEKLRAQMERGNPHFSAGELPLALGKAEDAEL